MPRKKTRKRANTYHAHRERQRRRILNAAWKLFDERGIDRVTMAEITSASGVQPSTMYQYFSNKDDIVWALVSELMREVSGRVKQAHGGRAERPCSNQALLEFMADELVEHQVKVRFMAQFDAMYARDWPAERLITLESQINPEGFQVFTDLIRDGIKLTALFAPISTRSSHACRHQRGDRCAAPTRLVGKQSRAGIRQAHRPPVPRNHPRDLAGIARPGNSSRVAHRRKRMPAKAAPEEVLMKFLSRRPIVLTALLACFVPVF